MKYLILTHFLINATILMFYILNKNSKLNTIWKEVIITILIGWIVVFVVDE